MTKKSRGAAITASGDYKAPSIAHSLHKSVTAGRSTVVVDSMVHCPWVSSQKLSTSIQVASELWSLVSKIPGEVSSIVAGDDHSALPFTGQELPKLKISRQIALYLSHCRLMEIVSG